MMDIIKNLIASVIPHGHRAHYYVHEPHDHDRAIFSNNRQLQTRSESLGMAANGQVNAE